MSTLAQLRDLRNRLATSDRLRSTVDHAADVAALDALLGAADALDDVRRRANAEWEEFMQGRAPYTYAVHRRHHNELVKVRERVDAILRGES